MRSATPKLSSQLKVSNLKKFNNVAVAKKDAERILGEGSRWWCVPKYLPVKKNDVKYTPQYQPTMQVSNPVSYVMLTSGEGLAKVSLSLLFLSSLLGAEGEVCVPIARINKKTITRAGEADVHNLLFLFSAPPLLWCNQKGAGMLSYYFRPKKVVKIFRDHHCDICRRNLKNQYHTELGFIITVRVCSDCRDIKRNFIQYLTSRDVEISIQKIVGWLADMKLLDVKLPLEIPRQIKPNRIFKPKKLAIQMTA